MLKDILLKCSDLLCREDISSAIASHESLSEIEDKKIHDEVERMICYFNFVMQSVCESCADLVLTDRVKSDTESKIFYYKFSQLPSKIISVVGENNREISFHISPTFIEIGSPNKACYVTYRFIPKGACDFNENLQIPLKIYEKPIIFGILSEFLAGKGQLEESEFWHDKFIESLYSNKFKRERRLKSTFKI